MATTRHVARRGAIGTLLGCWLAVAGIGIDVAAVPELVSYQGKLLDSVGAPVPDAMYPMEFRFYDDCVAGNLLLTDTQAAVETKNGIYSVLLGGGVLTPGVESTLQGVFANNVQVCLGVRVGADSEMVPRQLITSVAFALRAGQADSSPTAVSPGDNITWTGTQTFSETVNVADGKAIAWPQVTGNPPPTTHFRLTKFNAAPAGQENHPNGENDEQFMFCYNCQEGGVTKEDPTQHSWNQKTEMSFWDAVPDREQIEVNWNYRSPGDLRYRPFASVHVITGHCSNDGSICSDDVNCGVGNTCDGANQALYSWTADKRGICENDHTVSCIENSDCGGAECDEYKQVNVLLGSGILQPRAGVSIDRIHAGTLLGESLWALRVQSAIEPTDNGGTARGVWTNLDFNDLAAPDSDLIDVFGNVSNLVFSGTAAGRDVTNQFTGFDSTLRLTQTGGAGGDSEPPTISQANGYRWRLFAEGTNGVIESSAGIRLGVPAAFAPVDPIEVERHFGLLVEDQKSIATIEGDAVRVELQSGGSATQGNIAMTGGDWDNGHLRLGGGHLWRDSGDGQLRYKDGAPSSSNDGSPVHSPAGTDSNWGGTYWGTSGSAAHDTGDEVCGLAGLTCADTFDLGSSVSIPCGNSAGHTTSRFLVLCY